MAMTNGARPRIVALLNQKGGVGKTTTTANLGHALAIAGQRTCLIDLDPQGHLTLHLGIEPDQVSGTVYDLMVDPDCPVEDCIIREARPNLDVMLAEVDLAAVETELADQPHRRTILRDRFAAVADRYDVVLIDCPPSLGLLTVNALTMADELFVPMQAHFLALQGVGRLLETVRLVCSSVNADLKVAGVVLCMFERQTTLAKEILADLEGFFDSHRGSDAPWADCRVLHPPIRRNIKLAEAPSFGNTIFDYEPWCAGAIDYRRLAASLLERWGDPAASAEADTGTGVEAPGDSAAAEPRGEASSHASSEASSEAWTMSLGPATPASPVSPAPQAPPAAPEPEPPMVEIDLSGRSPARADTAGIASGVEPGGGGDGDGDGDGDRGRPTP
ncbi:MAG: ParA family protein [Planctomycetota bacterium]|jgi:chromosome partitioning protein